MLNNDETKASKEAVENTKNEKEENKTKQVNEEKSKTDTIDDSIKEDKQENIKTVKDNNDSTDKLRFSQYLKEGIKNTLGTFVVSIGVLAVLGLILRYIIGLYVVDAWGMLFIIYLIVSLFYPYIKSKFSRKNK